MKKAVLFDLYDTVLKDISFDFVKGIDHLYHAFFEGKCSLEEFRGYAATFLPLYEKRKLDHSEICLIRDEVPAYFEKFGVSMASVNSDELEYAMMGQMQKETLLEEVRDTLDELQKRGIGMYILSNSVFTGGAARRLLDEFQILHYFQKVFSSADYRVRKPSPRFFQIALDEITADDPGIEKGDILYVGNDYRTDVMGAVSMGLDTVWYNVGRFPNQNGVDISDIDDLRRLLEIVQR